MNGRNLVTWFADQLIISVQGGGIANPASVLIVSTNSNLGNAVYQWYRDGVAISGEVYDNYTIQSGDVNSIFYVVDTKSRVASNTITATAFSSLWDGLLVQHDFSLTKKNVRIWPDVDNNYLNGFFSFQTTEIAGTTGKAVKLDGTSATQIRNDSPATNYFSFADATSDLPLTISMRVKFDGTLATKRIFCHSSVNGTSTTIAYRAFIHSSGYLQFLLCSATESVNYRGRRTAAGAIVANTYYDLTFCYTGVGGNTAQNGVEIYIDGVRSDVTDETNGTYTKMPVYTSAGLYIGDGPLGKLSASINNMAVWSRKLSGAEIMTLHNGGIPLSKRANPFPEYYAIKYHILGRNGNYWFASDGDNLLYSTDAGVTYTTKAWGTQYTAGLPVYNKAIAFSYVFDDGTVMFCTAAAAYRSTDGLVNINSVTPKNMDGSDFVFHTPVDPTRPGAYFWTMNMDNKKEYVNGREMVVWGNYCNNAGGLGLGASPVVLWYTNDKGATIKNLYIFGQNDNYRDDGSAQGSTTGTLLGDPLNPLIARHIHCISRRAGTYEWWSGTGDIGTTREEICVLKHIYNRNTDVWTHAIILQNLNDNERYKLGNIAFIDPDNLIFACDSTTGAGNVAPSERGVQRTTVANFGTSSTQLYDETGGVGLVSAETTCLGFNYIGGKLISTCYEAATYSDSVWVSKAFGTSGLQRRKLPNAGSTLRPGRISPLIDNYWNFQIGWLNGPVPYSYFIRGN